MWTLIDLVMQTVMLFSVNMRCSFVIYQCMVSYLQASMCSNDSSVCGGWRSLRPWDCMNDVVQYERDFVIQTKTRHQTPIVHTASIIAEKATANHSRGHSRHPSMDHTASAASSKAKRVSLKHVRQQPQQENTSASALCDTLGDSESSLSAGTLLSRSVLQRYRDKLIHFLTKYFYWNK